MGKKYSQPCSNQIGKRGTSYTGGSCNLGWVSDWQVRWCRRHGTGILNGGLPQIVYFLHLNIHNFSSSQHNIRIASSFSHQYSLIRTIKTHIPALDILHFSRCNSPLSSLSPSLYLLPLLRVKTVLQSKFLIPAWSPRWDMSALAVQTTTVVFAQNGGTS